MAKRSRGHWFGGKGTAIVILRRTGQVLTGVTVRERSFRIVTPDLGAHAIQTSRIKSIVYKNLPTYPTDVIRLLNGTELNGEVTTDPIAIATADLGDASLARKNVLSIIF